MFFRDRQEAGRRLAGEVRALMAGGADTVVLGLPRGGVPVGEEVAAALRAPLDVCLVRKLGVPTHPELAAGAIGEDGVRVVNEDVMDLARVSPRRLAQVEEQERELLERRARAYREGRPRIGVEGRTVVLVDDGIATGATERAACQVVRARGARRVVVAVPVAPRGWAEKFAGLADMCVCPFTPPDFSAIGQFYTDFAEVPDAEVLASLTRAADRLGRPEAGVPVAGNPVAGGPGRRDGRHRDVVIPAGRARLPGELTVPERAPMVVVFAHGSGSSRHSSRNRFVARALNEAGLGTLLFDLLTAEEDRDRAMRFDIPLLADRLGAAVRWVRDVPEARRREVGCFGASTGAAAALRTAADPEARVAAVVSRGGRPDLAGDRLERVGAPTLLIVGGHDPAVLDLNRQAQVRLRGPSELSIVPGATHLFEEPGALESVAYLARDWFVHHCAAASQRGGA